MLPFWDEFLWELQLLHHINVGAAQPLQEADFPIQMLQMVSAKAVARHGARVVSKAPVLSSVSYFNVACGRRQQLHK